MIYLSGAKNPPLIPHLDAGTIALLNTPASNYTVQPGWTWAADNGCFNAITYVGDARWFAWLAAQPNRAHCLFATAPDVLGDHAATMTRSRPWLARIRWLGYPAAFVAQNGATPTNVPWDEFDVLFIGGDDAFKLYGSLPLIRACRFLGKPVHVGRVNSHRRYKRFAQLGVTSCDGTFLAFGPRENLPKLLGWVREHATAQPLWRAT
jgi:hypothetical protein